MTGRRYNTTGLAALLLTAMLVAPMMGQSTPASGVVLDRVVAIVNGDLILESDVDEERRLETIQPFRAATETTSDKIIERLIDRTLILQQAQQEFETPITDAAIDKEFATLRKEIPACKEYHCETDAGWEKFVTDQNFSMDELRGLWRRRLEVLRFIEQRFRAGTRVSDDEVKAYYDKVLLPEYVRRQAKAPPLASIALRIQEILLQQRVSGLLTDWLKTLRAQGSVKLLQPGEVAP
jgi:hypothetical protein